MRPAQSPFAGVDVELWGDDSTVNVSRMVRSDSGGTFTFFGLAPGHYHLEFYAARQLLGAAGPYLVAADSDVQRAYVLDRPDTTRLAPEDVDRTFSIIEVERPVRPLRSNPRVAFPAALAAQGVHGQVTVQFVVDESGRVVATSIRVLRSDDPRLTETVKTSVLEMRFEPAEIAGKPVKQLVRQSFDFLAGGATSMATPP